MNIIKPINIKNLEDLVKVHLNAFDGFFLSELGPNFLKLYYKSVLNSNKGILLGVFDDNRLIGFCAACYNSVGFNSSLIKSNFLSYGIEGVKILFSKPKALYRLFKNITKRGDKNDDGNYAELLSIAVNKNVQNSGAGRALMENLETELKDRGVRRLALTTDVKDNDAALTFYSKRGFCKMYDFITYPDRRMYRLIKTI